MRRSLTLLSGILIALSGCHPQNTNHETTSVASASPATLSLNGSDISRETLGGDFTLTDGRNKPFNTAALRGKFVLLSFGYTHCPDVCPTTLATLNEAIRQLGVQSAEVAVVFVSVDPERDTPAIVGKYTELFNPDFIGLTATGDQNIQDVKKQYRVISAKAEQKSADSYTVDHSAGTYILNREGQAVVYEPYGKSATEIADDLKKLLK